EIKYWNLELVFLIRSAKEIEKAIEKQYSQPSIILSVFGSTKVVGASSTVIPWQTLIVLP
ncbi:MAG: hypothetical protein ACI8RD_006840, partial [Bacillariaceae sp.]